jgi:hypothetical protein
VPLLKMLACRQKL